MYTNVVHAFDTTQTIVVIWLGVYVNIYIYIYLSTLASLTLIILFSKIISSKSENIVKENSEHLGIFHLLNWMFQN
jgi:hypothetical protein